MFNKKSLKKTFNIEKEILKFGTAFTVGIFVDTVIETILPDMSGVHKALVKVGSGVVSCFIGEFMADKTVDPMFESIDVMLDCLPDEFELTDVKNFFEQE